MNARKVAIWSVCGNLLLAGVVLLFMRQPPQPTVVVVETNSPVQIVEKPVTVPVQVPERFDWRKVESEDYRQYIANLRAIGCPEQTVRDIIIADVNALFNARRAVLWQPPEGFKFWKWEDMSPFYGPPAPKMQEQLQQLRLLAEDKRAMLRELLGIELPEAADAVFAPLNPRERLLGYLPVEKRLRVEEIEMKYGALLMSKLPEGSGHEQVTHFKKLEADKHAEIAAILTPQELDEYEMRFSPTAISLRAQLGDLNPSEHEFREMVRLRKQFDEEFNDPFRFDSKDETVAARKAAAQRELDGQMERLLGAQRYAEYKRSQDWGYRSALVAAEQAALPPAHAATIYEMKALALAEVERIRGLETLSPDERQQALDGVRGAVEEAVATVLGREGYAAYEKQFGSAWLRNLNRPALRASDGP